MQGVHDQLSPRSPSPPPRSSSGLSPIQPHTPPNEHTPINQEVEHLVPNTTWRDRLPSAATVRNVARGGAQIADMTAGLLAISHATMTGKGQLGRAEGSGALWAGSGMASMTSTIADLYGARNEPPSGSMACRVAYGVGTGMGLVADAFNVGAGLASEAAATGDATAGRISNGMWMAAGAASLMSGAVSMGTAMQDMYHRKAGAGWGMMAALAQVASGGANFAAGAFGYEGVEHNDSDDSRNNLASSIAWTAGATLGTMSALFALKARRAAQTAQIQPEARRADIGYQSDV